jgi:hypothetical protein
VFTEPAREFTTTAGAFFLLPRGADLVGGGPGSLWSHPRASHHDGAGTLSSRASRKRAATNSAAVLLFGQLEIRPSVLALLDEALFFVNNELSSKSEQICGSKQTCTARLFSFKGFFCAARDDRNTQV